jgi:hypothetical protein
MSNTLYSHLRDRIPKTIGMIIITGQIVKICTVLGSYRTILSNQIYMKNVFSHTRKVAATEVDETQAHNRNFS